MRMYRKYVFIAPLDFSIRWLMRTDGILSRASTTVYYAFNQMRRILGLVTGMQLMDPDQ
jgi:hypothetical protein